MINKIIKILILLFLFYCLMPINIVYAMDTVNPDENYIIESQLDMLNLDDMDNLINSLDNKQLENISIKQIALKAVKGELDLSPEAIITYILNLFFSEIKSLLGLIRNMIIIAVLSGLLKNLSSSFLKKSVAELSFFINYIVAVMLLISTFKISIELASSLINALSVFMNGSIYILLTLVAMSGSVTSTFILNGLLVFIINFLSNIINKYILTVIILAASLELVNYISEKETLQKAAELIKNCCTWLLRIIVGLFITVLSLQGVSAPLVNNIFTKTTKSALNLVPVIGGALSGAVDTVMSLSNALKGGFMVAFIIILLMICSVPIIKLVSFIFVFKLTAAILQPICDERIINAIGSVSSYVSMILGICVTVSFMFISIVIILLGVI